MKKNPYHLLLLLITCCIFYSCKKNKTVNQIDLLPAETHTGANTFGCLVNGVAFKPGGYFYIPGGHIQANYQWLPPYQNGGSHSLVIIARYKDNSVFKAIGIYTDSLKIAEGGKYPLQTLNKGYASGEYYLAFNPTNSKSFKTNGNTHTGELWIKKLDTLQNIVSGTFWFDAVDNNGEKVEVREGRFDVRYTN